MFSFVKAQRQEGSPWPKPENVLLRGCVESPKLTDFGGSRVIETKPWRPNGPFWQPNPNLRNLYGAARTSEPHKRWSHCPTMHHGHFSFEKLSSVYWLASHFKNWAVIMNWHGISRKRGKNGDLNWAENTQLWNRVGSNSCRHAAQPDFKNVSVR